MRAMQAFRRRILRIFCAISRAHAALKALFLLAALVFAVFCVPANFGASAFCVSAFGAEEGVPAMPRGENLPEKHGEKPREGAPEKGAPEKGVPAGEKALVPALEAAAESVNSAAAQKLFYKISLNESCFIKEREATVNARTTVEILQGEPEKISLEVFGVGSGQGEIFSVAGENVRDWSIRRENTRVFIEIRPKDLGEKRSFTFTVSGRTPLKLPTTVQPILFSGTDSAAFFGVVQIMATSDLRLYAKQERGLIQVGERSRSEVNYAIVGAPSVRLDIARANELLAPVSLEDFSLAGTVSPESTRFALKAKALVREAGAEVVVLSGNAALLDFPEKSGFVVLAGAGKESGAPEYSLRFPTRGEFDVELHFDAGIDDPEGWRRMNFAVPIAQVAPYSLSGMPADTVFAADNVSIPKIDGNGVFSGFLPTSGALNLRWRPSIQTPPEFSASVFAVDVLSEMQISTGILRQRNEFAFSVSQGEISALFFEISGEGEILSVDGADLLSWTLVSSASRRGIVVRFSRAQTGNCRLRIVSQTRAAEFPVTLHPLRFTPAIVDVDGEPLAAVCVRNNEFLRLRNGIGVRCEALPQGGLMQVAPTAFPQPADDEFFGKSASAGDVSVYRITGEAEHLAIRADFVRPELIVAPRMRWIFGEEKTTAALTADFEVRDAPLYEMQILVPADLEPTAFDSELVAAREFAETSEKEGFRRLNLVFSEPILGAGRIAITFRKNAESGAQSVPAGTGAETTLRACLFPQAHFVFGVLGISAQQKERLIPLETENLAEIPPREYSAEHPPQLAFRMRDGNWRLRIRREERPCVLTGTTSCVYKIGNDKIRGDFRADYTAHTGVPAQSVRLAFPRDAEITDVSAEKLSAWSVGADGIATLVFAGSPGEKFSVSAKFEWPVSANGERAFEGVALCDVAGEEGTILLTADGVADVEDSEKNPPPQNALARLAPAEAEALAGARERGGAILLRAYQFAERPFSLKLRTRLLPGTSAAPIFVKEMRVRTDASRASEISCDVRSFGATELRVGVPDGMQIAFPGAREVGGSGVFALPLPPGAEQIVFRIFPKNAAAVAPAAAAGTEKILLPRIFAPVAKIVFAGTGEAESPSFRVVSGGRKLNASFDAELLSRLGRNLKRGSGVFAASLVVALGALALAGRNWRVQHKHRARAFAIVALLGATLFAVAAVWLFADALRAEYGETILAAGMTEPGAQLEIALRRFDFLGAETFFSAPRPTVLALVFFGGVFWLFAGTVLRERLRVAVHFSENSAGKSGGNASPAGAESAALRRVARARIFGRILVYATAALLAVEDFPFHVPAFVAAMLVVEIFVALVQAAARCVFGKEKLPGGNAIAPALAAIFALWFACAPVDLRAESSPENSGVPASAVSGFAAASISEEESAHDVADRISQAIDVRSDRIVSRGDVRVTGIAGDRFDLLASPAVLTSFEKNDGAMIRLERIRSAAGTFGYQIVLERAGTFGARFSYELAVPENAHGFTLPTGAAAADVATVRIARDEVRVGASGSVSVSAVPVGEHTQIAQIVFKPKTARRVEWNPQERDRSREELRLFASGENLYLPAAGVIEGRHAFKFAPAQGEVSGVRIRVPKPFSVSGLEGSAIHRWNFNRDSGILTVLFTAPRTSEFSLSILTQAQLSALPARQTFAALSALDCEEQVRTIGLATGETLQVDAVTPAALVPIDEEEFAASLAEAGLSVPAEMRLRRAFRTVGNDGDFEAELSSVRPNLRVECTEDFYVNSDSVRGDIAFEASVSRAELFNFSFKISAGTEVDSVRGDALSYWTKEICEDDGATRVTLHLKNALAGTQKFRVRLSGAFPQNAGTWTPPSFVAEDAQTQRGEIAVHAEEGLRLSPEGAVPAQTVDGATGDTFRFRYHNRANVSPRFAVLESKPFTAAAWLHCVCADGAFACSAVTAIFDVENVKRDSVQLRLPEAALAPRFFGEDVVSAEKIPGGDGVWEIRFSKPVRGRVEISAEFRTPLPTAPNFAVPAVAAVGVDSENAWLAVARGNAFSALVSRSPEKFSAEDVPEELREKLSGDAGAEWFIEKFSGKNHAEIALSPEFVAARSENFPRAAGNVFKAAKLERRTVFSRDKALTEERFVSENAQSGILRVALPEGGELKAATVNGVPAEIVGAGEASDPENAGAPREVRIPIFASGGNGPNRVELVYAHPLKIVSGSARAGVAELVPARTVSADEIFWSLSSDGGAAEIRDVCGLEPDVLRVAGTPVPEAARAAAGFTDAYFGASAGNADGSAGKSAGSDDTAENFQGTFRLAGTERRAQRVQVAFGAAPESPGPKLNVGFVLVLLVAFAVLKLAPSFVARSRRRGKASAASEK